MWVGIGIDGSDHMVDHSVIEALIAICLVANITQMTSTMSSVGSSKQTEVLSVVCFAATSNQITSALESVASTNGISEKGENKPDKKTFRTQSKGQQSLQTKEGHHDAAAGSLLERPSHFRTYVLECMEKNVGDGETFGKWEGGLDLEFTRGAVVMLKVRRYGVLSLEISDASSHDSILLSTSPGFRNVVG